MLVPVDRTGRAPGTAMTEPRVFTVRHRSIKTEGIAAKPLGTGRCRKDALHGLLLQNPHAVLADAKVHQHLVELQLVAGSRPKPCPRRREHTVIVIRTLHRAILLNPLCRLPLRDVENLNLVRKLLVSRPECGCCHSKRVKETLLKEDLPPLACHDLHDRRSDVDADV